MNGSLITATGLAAAILAGAVMLAGCETITAGLEELGNLSVESQGSATGEPQKVPSPINLLLPRKVRIHPFTGTRTFDQAGGVRGIDVRIEARDAFDDPTKAFGDFRFELYSYRPYSPDPRGQRIASWHESLMATKKNLRHWDGIAKRYQFKLVWDQPIPVGDRFVLAATFTSPFTDRLFDQRVFVSGQ